VTRHPSETQEWEEELLESWVETYKKAMTTPILLRLIDSNQPVAASALAALVPEQTGLHLTERGLYRTLRRLEDHGLIQHTTSPAPRTGAQRKDFRLTESGARLLTALEEQIRRVDPHRRMTDARGRRSPEPDSTIL
jgi:DNA-binding PadR family transcriptional regulator